MNQLMQVYYFVMNTFRQSVCVCVCVHMLCKITLSYFWKVQYSLKGTEHWVLQYSQCGVVVGEAVPKLDVLFVSLTKPLATGRMGFWKL